MQVHKDSVTALLNWKNDENANSTRLLMAKLRIFVDFYRYINYLKKLQSRKIFSKNIPNQRELVKSEYQKIDWISSKNRKIFLMQTPSKIENVVKFIKIQSFILVTRSEIVACYLAMFRSHWKQCETMWAARQVATRYVVSCILILWFNCLTLGLSQLLWFG